MKKRWWNVWTGSSGDERSGESVFLGAYFGFVDDLALALAHKQSGFWCDGKLTFEPIPPPKKTVLPKRTGKPAHVVIRGHDWFGGTAIKKAKAFFRGRPVDVAKCSQYAAVTISPRKRT